MTGNGTTTALPKRATPGTVSYAFRRLTERWRARAGVLVLAMLALVSIFADLLAADLPLVCAVDGTVYVAPCDYAPRLTHGAR